MSNNAKLMDEIIRRTEEAFNRHGHTSGFAFVLQNVRASLQNGPQCGIVALHMAASCLRLQNTPSVEQIMTTAKNSGVSNFGEVLSAYWMADLAAQTLGCFAEVRRLDELRSQDILDHLLTNGGPILMPYDCDKNFEPCKNDGRSAHWCLLVGFLLVRPGDAERRLTWIDESQKAEALLRDRAEGADLFLLAMQSKSRHPAVWSWKALTESNANLFRLGRIGPADGERFRWPQPDLGQLRGKLVTLRH